MSLRGLHSLVRSWNAAWSHAGARVHFTCNKTLTPEVKRSRKTPKSSWNLKRPLPVPPDTLTDWGAMLFTFLQHQQSKSVTESVVLQVGRTKTGPQLQAMDCSKKMGVSKVQSFVACCLHIAVSKLVVVLLVCDVNGVRRSATCDVTQRGRVYVRMCV